MKYLYVIIAFHYSNLSYTVHRMDSLQNSIIIEFYGYILTIMVGTKNIDDSNVSRKSTNDNWRQIQKNANNYYACLIIRSEIKTNNAQELFDQIIDCALSISAIMDYNDEEQLFFATKKYMMNKLKQQGTSFETEKNKRNSNFDVLNTYSITDF